MMSPILSIVFSFRNEEAVIPELLQRCRAVSQQLISSNRISSAEYVFVDDDSSDHSFNLLKKEDADKGDIKIVRMSTRFGTSVCVLAGMEYSCGDYVVYMDSDLQDPPELIPKLIQEVEKDSEVQVVHTKRSSRAGENGVKLAVTRLGYWILHFLSNYRLPVECGDFKLLTRRAVNEVLRFKDRRPLMRWLVCLVGFKQAFAPYDREARGAGESHFPIFSWKVISNFLESALVGTSIFPLHLISFGGLCCSGLFGLVLIYILIEKYLGLNLPGWTAIMVAILFIGSVQILSIGLIGIYVGAVFEEVKNRLSYIVNKTFGFKGNTLQSKLES